MREWIRGGNRIFVFLIFLPEFPVFLRGKKEQLMSTGIAGRDKRGK